MVRFFNDKGLTTDDQTFSARVRELNELEAVPNSFKGIFKIESELLSSGSNYQANLAHIQYGGTEIYMDDKNNPQELIEQKYTYHKIYIKDTSKPQDLVSGKNSNDYTDSPDGFHVLISNPKTVRIPNWFDVVLR